jgi:hypothetical protein
VPGAAAFSGGTTAATVSAPAAPPPEGCDRRCQRLRYLRVSRRLTQFVAARRLGPLLGRDLNRQGGQQQLVDVESGRVVRAHREDDGVLGRRPRSQQPVVAVQVATAHVVQRSAGKAIPGLLAAVRDQRLEGAPGGLGASPA